MLKGLLTVLGVGGRSGGESGEVRKREREKECPGGYPDSSGIGAVGWFEPAGHLQRAQLGDPFHYQESRSERVPSRLGESDQSFG